MSYKQLTQNQRYQIYACMKANWSQLEIAAEIGVHPSTISREVKRNQGGRGYRPKQAQQRTEERKLKHVAIRSEPQTWTLIERRAHLSIHLCGQSKGRRPPAAFTLPQTEAQALRLL